jgi:hypothetical protein
MGPALLGMEIPPTPSRAESGRVWRAVLFPDSLRCIPRISLRCIQDTRAVKRLETTNALPKIFVRLPETALSRVFHKSIVTLFPKSASFFGVRHEQKPFKSSRSANRRKILCPLPCAFQLDDR